MEHVRQSIIEAAMKEPPTRTLRSGELAGLAGVSRDTLRYYERHRLLPATPRSQNGYRRYPEETVSRIRLIRAALGIGFTIDELGEIFAMRDAGRAPCQRVHALAIEKSRALAKRIEELKRAREALQAAIGIWGRKLKSIPPGRRVGLLEVFVANHPESPKAISPNVSPGLKRKMQTREDRLR